MEDNCLFCKIVKGDIPASKVYEDEDVLAFRDINPAAKIHILLVPKKHIASLAEVKEEDGMLIAKMHQVVNKIAILKNYVNIPEESSFLFTTLVL